MKVFLDTNVLVSAFGTRGLSADLVRLVMAEHTLVTGEVVLAELRRVLSSKFRLPRERIDQVEALLRRYHVEPLPADRPDLPVRDEDDAWILASALSAGADVLVTGDKDLLVLADMIPGIQITDPRGFWELVRRTGT